MSRWFRFYDDVMDDPKVQMLSDAHYRGWTTLLCFASKNDGNITSDESVLSFALRKPVGKVRDLIQACLSAGLIDPTDTGYTPHNWNGRQFKSDDSKERVKQFRKRSAERDGNGDVTANVTPPETEQRQSRTETEKKDAPLRSVVVSKPKVEIPDWIPPEAWAGFVEMRRKIRQPMTDRGILLTISALKKLRTTEDIGAVLDQSTMKNYRGVFPVKHEGNGNGQRQRPATAHDKSTLGAALAIASLGGHVERPGEANFDSDADRPQLSLLAS